MGSQEPNGSPEEWYRIEALAVTSAPGSFADGSDSSQEILMRERLNQHGLNVIPVTPELSCA